jgi:hypothetical protein
MWTAEHEAHAKSMRERPRSYTRDEALEERAPSPMGPRFMGVAGTVVPISLTRGYHALVSQSDYERVAALKWRAHTGSDGRVYAKAHMPGSGRRGKSLSMHRFILGVTDPKVKVDHADGDGLHNWRTNLRRSSNAQNVRNQAKHRDSTSPYKGIYQLKNGLWRAQIMCQYKKIYLGTFTSPKDAALCYDANAKKLHGEFARLNFAEVA